MAFGTFGELPILLSTKVNLLYLLYSTSRRSSAFNKAKLLAKDFSENSNLYDSGIFFTVPVFPSRTNLKLHNVSVTAKLVQKVITSLDSSQVSGPDCILKKLWAYILAELFNICLKESYFPDCWKVSSVIPVFKNVGERSTARSYRHISLLFVVSEIFEKLVSNSLFNDLEKCGILSDLQWGSWSSWLTADLLIFVYDRLRFLNTN